MSISTRSRMVRYGFSIASVFISVGASFILQPFFSQGSLLLFVPAVALSAWFVGLGPGLFAGLISILTMTVFFISPTGSMCFDSVTDVARHAQATRVDISLKADLEQAKLLLEVRDNGHGISPAEMHKLNRFGLIGMRERVTPPGGKIDIRGAPGKGTVVDVSVPLELDGEAPKLESLVEAY